MPLARGLQRKVAAAATSAGTSGCVRGALVETYSTILPMMPMALAAREAHGPAEMQFRRTPYLRPASYARTRVSLSRAALADDMPPPYPGITRSLAMYEREMHAPPGRMRGARRCTMDTME